MKKIILIFAVLASCLSFTSCKDDWDYDHDLENVFFFGPELWGYDASKLGNNNVLTYNVEQGQTVEVPMQFWCKFPVGTMLTYYYTAPKPADQKYYSQPWKNKDQVTYDGTELVRGVDYEVVDAKGNVLTPDATGAFSLSWTNGGVQNIYIKALNGKKGAFNLQTFNPASDVTLTNQDVESTVQHRTSDYEVRIFSQNYRVTIVVK